MKNTTVGMHALVASAIALAMSFGTPTQAAVRLGFEIGANVSSLGYENLDAISFITSHWDPGSRTSLTGGTSLEFPLRRRFSVMTGLRYVQQGNRVKFDFPGSQPVTGEFRIAQHYLAVPLLLAFRPVPSRRFSLAAGPEGAVLLNGKIFTDYSPSGGASTSDSITRRLERANLSLDVETSLEFPARNHFGSVILRYTHGLVDVEKKADWGVAWKTRGVEGLVGMRW